MKKFLHIIFIFCGEIFFSSQLLSQNQPAFEQYHFNQFVLNPAYAGSKGTMDVAAFLRRQWSNFEGAPETETITLNSQINNGKTGLGGKLIHDKTGVTEKFQFTIDYAYRIYTNAGVFSVGIDAGISNYKLNYNKLSAFHDGDPAFVAQPQTIWSPNVGLGFYFSNKIFFAGLSAPALLDNADSISTSFDSLLTKFNVFEQSRDYYATAGVLINAANNFAVKPYALIKYNSGSGVQADASMSFIFYEQFWIGGSYRTNNSVTILVDYFLKKDKILKENTLGFGYAFNFILDNVESFFGPTHEFFITYNLVKSNTRIVSPRFF